MKHQISQLVEQIEKINDKARLMRSVDELVILSEQYDDNEAVDALCYIITKTEDTDVWTHALTVIDKINRR